MKNRHLIAIVLFSISSFCYGQNSRSQIDEWIEKQQYTNPENKDSLLIWSDMLLKASKQLNYSRAEAYSVRMKGLFHDFNNETAEAAKYYLVFLEKSKLNKNLSDEMSATSDLIYIYFSTNQLQKAKPLILSFTNRKNKAELNQKKLAIFFNNLGIIYRKEKKEDSAIFAYRESLKIKEILKDEKGLTNLRINLSSLLVNTKKYSEALKLSEQNIIYLQKNNSPTDLWYNLINKAGALDGLKRYDECQKYLEDALDLSKKLQSKSFEQLSYEQLSGTYSNQKKYDLAYEFLKKSNIIQAELLNEETNKKIAELQEQHNADEREKQNQLLSSQLEAQKNKQNAYIIGILALLGLTSVIGFSFYKNNKKNQLIAAQNQKLKELNTEKNHLISIVSHDLSSPFSTIKLWINTLNNESSAKELADIKNNILKTTTHGLQTIKGILDFDKNELKEIEFEKTDIADLIKELFTFFEPQLKEKAIALKIKIGHESENILSDKNLLFRLLSNLLSNAIKFSHPNTEIIFNTYETEKTISFEIQDFGIGIPSDQLPNLFERYANISTKPTNQEDSRGLGLSIVKRISDELGGDITVNSEIGKGTVFNIVFKK